MITKCPHCNVDLVMGKAIDPHFIHGNRVCGCFNHNRVLKADEVELIDCLKCPKCGHCDDGR